MKRCRECHSAGDPSPHTSSCVRPAACRSGVECVAAPTRLSASLGPARTGSSDSLNRIRWLENLPASRNWCAALCRFGAGQGCAAVRIGEGARDFPAPPSEVARFLQRAGRAAETQAEESRRPSTPTVPGFGGRPETQAKAMHEEVVGDCYVGAARQRLRRAVIQAGRIDPGSRVRKAGVSIRWQREGCRAMSAGPRLDGQEAGRHRTVRNGRCQPGQPKPERVHNARVRAGRASSDSGTCGGGNGSRSRVGEAGSGQQGFSGERCPASGDASAAGEHTISTCAAASQPVGHLHHQFLVEDGRRSRCPRGGYQ